MTDNASPLAPTIDAHLSRLAFALADGAGEELLAYLRFTARFHTYSAGNQLLIHAQAPEARRVAGFKAWLAMGHPVLRGATAIRILAPIVVKKDVSGREERVVTGFRTVSVFGDHQVQGPLPGDDCLRVAPSEAATEDALRDLVARCPLEVAWDDRAPTEGRLESGRIVLNPAAGGSAAQDVRTLLRLWSHAELDARPAKDAPSEVEADASAFVLCALLGIDATAAVSAYVRVWGGDAASLKKSLSRVRRAVKAVAARAMPSEVGHAA